MDLPDGISWVTNPTDGHRALMFNSRRYDLHNMGDVIVVTNKTTRSTELIIPGYVDFDSARRAYRCGDHIHVYGGTE